MAGTKGNSGGARVGAGRKRQDDAARWLGGDAGRRGRKEKPAPAPPVETFGPPLDLTELHLEVWQRLAPHAFQARTLTKGTAAAFRDLCEAVVVRDGLLTVIHQSGYLLNGQKHPLLTDYRGMYQRVESGMARFRLSPMGKPMVEESAAPADPFAEFDSPTSFQ